MGYYGYQPPVPPRRRRSCWTSCLTTLVVLVFLLLGLVLAALFFLKPQLSQEFGDKLGLQLDGLVDQKIGEQFGNIDGLPSGSAGTVIVLESEVNAYLEAHPEEIAPLESATVRFAPADVQATVSAYGISGTAHADLRAENGQLVVLNPRIDGALSMLLDADELGTALETSLNQQMSANGLRITDVTIETGQMSLSLEN